MGKIIKSNLEQVKIQKESFTLGIKGQFKIEFANDNFGPYDYKFEREDCYYQDGLEDRGVVNFPLKNKSFDNTEIFLERDEIVVCTGERSGLITESQTFIDIINLKTEKKQRIFTPEVNLIYNEKDTIIVNIKVGEIFKTFKLDINKLDIVEEIEEELQAFFKCVYNKTQNKWFILDFVKTGKGWNDGYFSLKGIDTKGEPKSFDRKKYKVNGNIDIWELSSIIYKAPEDINFMNHQKYVMSQKIIFDLHKKILYLKKIRFLIPIKIIYFFILIIHIYNQYEKLQFKGGFSYEDYTGIFLYIIIGIGLFLYKIEKKYNIYLKNIGEKLNLKNYIIQNIDRDEKQYEYTSQNIGKIIKSNSE